MLRVIALTRRVCVSIHDAGGYKFSITSNRVLRSLCLSSPIAGSGLNMQITAQDINATDAFTSTVVGMLLCFM